MPQRKVQAAQTPALETRDKLLQAAIEVFSESGYDGATVREICRRADVNIALVSYHFGDKLALYRAVIRFVTNSDARTELARQAALGTANPKESLRQLIRGLLERIVANHEQSGLHFRLMLKELANPTTVLTDEIETTIRPLYDHIRTSVGAILKLPPDHETTRLCTHSILGQVTHYVHARPILVRLWPEMRFSPEQIERIADHIADFSLAYIHPPKKLVKPKTTKKSQRKRNSL
ncbi:MAG: CerR family C-terminal domain-containing protein [Acidobacteriaceae bacterium]|nr:CerR family C-terminal domain-containing protein [Acidobacteriaceae bacterium]